MKHQGVEAIEAASRADWRNWLAQNHAAQVAVWLIIYKKSAPVDSVHYPEAVDEALCFGWVDSKPNKRDDQSYYQYFSQRNPKSNWSRVNKEKVARLTEQNLMSEAGLEMVRVAKATGTWDALNDVDNLVIPDDLKQMFAEHPQAFSHWKQFPDSTKRGILEWIFNAKRPETRAKRMRQTVDLATLNQRANQYTKKS